MIGLKSFTLAWIFLLSETRNHQVTWIGECPSKNKQTKSRERLTYISFILKPCDLKFGMTLFYFMKPARCRLYILHILCLLKRVGSVSSRSDLDPFLYIWYHTVRTQSGLRPCAIYLYFFNTLLSRKLFAITDALFITITKGFSKPFPVPRIISLKHFSLSHLIYN